MHTLTLDALALPRLRLPRALPVAALHGRELMDARHVDRRDGPLPPTCTSPRARPRPCRALTPRPTPTPSQTHQINRKFNEGLSAWPAFAADPSRFAALFARVVDLPAERAAAEGAPAMSDDEHTRCPSPYP